MLRLNENFLLRSIETPESFQKYLAGQTLLNSEDYGKKIVEIEMGYFFSRSLRAGFVDHPTLHAR